MSLTTSIALCTFNGARFLEAQWESLLAQSRRPDEIVVRDDGSTDGTPELLERLRGRTESMGVRVNIAYNARNLGYVQNFSGALQAASGDIVFLCDQDDVWRPEKLARQVAAFEQVPALLLLCTDARRVGPDGADLGRSLFDVLAVTRAELRCIHGGRGFAVLARRSMATGATVAMRRSLLAAALPVPRGWVHDEWLAATAAALDGFDCLEEALIDYRQHPDNQIGMPERGWRDKWRDLLRARAGLLDALIARSESLDAWLDARRGPQTQHWHDELAQELLHWRWRRRLTGAPWRRAAPIVRELLSGRYNRYGTGWRSALRDLLRRG